MASGKPLWLLVEELKQALKDLDNNKLYQVIKGKEGKGDKKDVK